MTFIKRKFPSRTKLIYEQYSITVISIEELSTWSTKRLLRFYSSIRAQVDRYYNRSWCCELKHFHLFESAPENYKLQMEYYDQIFAYQNSIKELLNTRENIKNYGIPKTRI